MYSSFVQGNERSRDGCIPIEPSSRDLHEGLLPSILYSIERPEAGSYRSDINHVRCIGSYDWIDDAKPTIVVPGKFSLMGRSVADELTRMIRFASNLEADLMAFSSPSRPKQLLDQRRWASSTILRSSAFVQSG